MFCLCFGDWALNSDWSLPDTTLLKGRLHAPTFLAFDRNQNILATKNVEQTSSNMHATRSNIDGPLNVL